MAKISDARRAANDRWDAKNLDRIGVALPVGYRDKLKTAAAAEGISVNAFVRKAIDAALKI